MASKTTYYCTKKRIDEFILSKLHIYSSLNEFKTDLKNVIVQLKEYPKDNKNQIWFFSKVLSSL